MSDLTQIRVKIDPGVLKELCRTDPRMVVLKRRLKEKNSTEWARLAKFNEKIGDKAKAIDNHRKTIAKLEAVIRVTKTEIANLEKQRAFRRAPMRAVRNLIERRRAQLEKTAGLIALRKATKEMKRTQPAYHAHHDRPKPVSTTPATSADDLEGNREPSQTREGAPSTTKGNDPEPAPIVDQVSEPVGAGSQLD